MKKALEIDLEDDETWANKGLLLEETCGKYEDALECFEKALEATPNSPMHWKWKGTILEDLKEPEEALKCYKETIKLNLQKQYTMVHATKNTAQTRQTQRSN